MDIETAIAKAMDAAADALLVHGSAIIPSSHQADVTAALLSLWGDAAKERGREVIEQFKDCYDLETKEDDESFFDQVLREFSEIYGGQAINGIAETTKRQIAQLVFQGQMDGLTLEQISAAIREAIPGISKLRGHVISRTERHSAAGYASQATARKSRSPLLKTWVSVSDHRTRDFGEGDGIVDDFSHRAMNGVTVAMDDPYQVPMITGEFEAMMFPGDPNASAGNRIMCRCAETYKRANQ